MYPNFSRMGMKNLLFFPEHFSRTTCLDESYQERYNLSKTGCATHFTAQESGCAQSVVPLLETQKVGAQMHTLRIRLYCPCVLKLEQYPALKWLGFIIFQT